MANNKYFLIQKSWELEVLQTEILRRKNKTVSAITLFPAIISPA